MSERSDWRDSNLNAWHTERGFNYPTDDRVLSKRHRKWGNGITGTDMDWPFVEYNYGIAIALVDYKYRRGLRPLSDYNEETDKTSYNNRALSDFYTSHGPVPYYVTFYIKEPWTFRVFPMNDSAQRQAPKKQVLTELEYVTWLHEIREYKINEYLARTLDNQLQWDSLLPPLAKRKHKKDDNKSPYTLFDQNPTIQQTLEVSE